MGEAAVTTRLVCPDPKTSVVPPSPRQRGAFGPAECTCVRHESTSRREEGHGRVRLLQHMWLLSRILPRPHLRVSGYSMNKLTPIKSTVGPGSGVGPTDPFSFRAMPIGAAAAVWGSRPPNPAGGPRVFTVFGLAFLKGPRWQRLLRRNEEVEGWGYHHVGRVPPDARTCLR